MQFPGLEKDPDALFSRFPKFVKPLLNSHTASVAVYRNLRDVLRRSGHCKLPEHQACHDDVTHRFAAGRPDLIIFAQAPIWVEPGPGALDKAIVKSPFYLWELRPSVG